ncbi:MAG: GNAT family N-acetyltransferase [Acetatifactor sp.]
MIAPIEQKFGMRVHMECVNACYTNREQMPVKHKDIRLLTMDELDYVMQHYEFSSLDYITERIQSGAMVGAWLDGELVGFAGEHEEGGLGLLYVHPDVRRKGIGESLEAYVVNRHLALGYTPYGQIVVGNDKSINLQEKHGLYLSEGHVWWMDFG